ncbi:MAG TPA: fumarylacetoacetate hydrolase family protein [Ramlibacter sp.]|nr:fumarylacetoacetate hydrolase family protein [Ramlibacter sp.]
MKLVNFLAGGEARIGVVQDGRVLDLSKRIGRDYPEMVAFIERGGLAEARRIAAVEKGEYDYEAVQLLPVVPNPRRIFCIGLNYHDHVAEADKALGGREVPKKPMVFARWPESLTAHRAAIKRPKVSDQLDWEAELLVVIGQQVPRYTPVEKALDYVFGYSAMNEACLRDYQFHSRQLTPGKNFAETGATGPWLVTADEIPDPQALEIQMRLNGEVMQHANTSGMVFSVAQLISYISDWLPLLPGDLIASGTMGGVGFARKPPVFMKPGDRAEVSIERIGTLVNSVEDENLG